MTLHPSLPAMRIRLARSSKRLLYIALLGALPLALSFGIAHAASAFAPDFPGSIYVTVQGANAVEALPDKRVYSGLTTAHYDAVSRDGKILIAGSYTTGDVYIVNTETGDKLATINIGTSVQGVNITPDGHWAVAVDPNGGRVAVIDVKTLKLAKFIKVGEIPHNVAFTADSKTAYVTLQGGTGVAVIDLGKLEKVDEIPIPGVIGPHNLDFSDHGKILWVRDIVGHVAVVDVETKKELAVIPVGHGHAGIDVIPGGRYVFTGAIADDVVDVIDPKTFKVVKRIQVGKGPHGVRASTDGRYVYADVTQANDVVVIDTKTLKVVKTLPTVGGNPFWVAVPGHD